MSENVFYADLDKINNKGVLVTGHGKGLVARNSIINGEYIVNDMVRLTIKDNKLFGYQGYIESEDNELTKIEYLLYFYDKYEANQPTSPELIDVEKYLSLSKHNIDTGEQISMMFSGLPKVNAFTEYKTILEQAKNVIFAAIPFTTDENDRATYVNNLVK